MATPAKAIATKIKSKTAESTKTKTTAKKAAGVRPGASTKKRASSKPRKAIAPYLAVELGQPSDRDGEPIGAGSPKLQSDEDLQTYALKLWRQMQSGSVVNRYTRAIERAGLTVDEVWTAGVGEIRQTSSTEDEIRRYRQKVLFRANLLEAILTETVADLRRLEDIEPAPARVGELAADEPATETKRGGAAHGRQRRS